MSIQAFNLDQLKSRPLIIFVLSVVAIFVPIILRGSRPEARATKRILKAVREAEAPMHGAGGLPEVQALVVKLRSMNLAGAPREVTDAVANYIAAVEENARVRIAGGNTNAANDKVAEAKRGLHQAAEKGRGSRE